MGPQRHDDRAGQAGERAILVGECVVVGGCVAFRPALDHAVLADGEAFALLAGWAIASSVALWHLAGTLVCAAARRRPEVAALRSLARFAPAVVRRAAGVTCTVSVLLTPAVAGAAEPPGADRAPAGAAAARGDEPVVRTPATVRDGRTARSTTTTGTRTTTTATTTHGVPADPTTTTATAAPAATPTRSVPAPPPPAPPPPPADARGHVIAPGDNLWRIATDEVARVTGVADPDDAVVAPYWRAVVAANRATLRSGNPSLVFPGEIVTLPPFG